VYLSEAKDSFGIIFQKPGVSVQNLDRGLILEKPRGFFAKMLGIIDFGIIFVRKKSWTRSTGRAPHPASVHGGPRTRPRWWLAGAQPSGRSGPRQLATRVATQSGRGSMTGEPLTRAWTTVRRRRDGGGALAQKGDSVAVAERRRGQAGGVGVFRRVGVLLKGWGRASGGEGG
jgi:hypothetical protein